MSTPPAIATPNPTMALITDIFAWAGTAMALALMLAPSVLFVNIFKNKKEGEKYDTRTVPELMLVFNAGCGLLWFSYWFRVVNPIPCYSALANTTVTIVFSYIYLYCYSQGQILKWLLYCFVATDLLAQLIYACVYLIGNAEIVGKAAMIVNILMFAAPGQNIFKVITTGEYELIPIVSTFVGLLTSICWFVFGLLQNIMNCYIPNGIGIFLSVLQIVIYYYFYFNKKDEKKTTEKKDSMLDAQDSAIN